jgi:hypothetical protein
MENTNMPPFRKVINKSILKEGIPIVSPYRELIYQQLPELKTRGTVMPVKIYMNGTTYNIELYNNLSKKLIFQITHLTCYVSSMLLRANLLLI